MRHTVIMLILLIVITGCTTHKDVAVSRLKRVDQAKLIHECKTLWAELNKTAKPELFEIPSDRWPNSIADMQPMQVRNYNDGIAVVFHKFVSKEDGLFIATTDKLPQNKLNVGFEELSPRIYWYWISG